MAQEASAEIEKHHAVHLNNSVQLKLTSNVVLSPPSGYMIVAFDNKVVVATMSTATDDVNTVSVHAFVSGFVDTDNNNKDMKEHFADPTKWVEWKTHDKVLLTNSIVVQKAVTFIQTMTNRIEVFSSNMHFRTEKISATMRDAQMFTRGSECNVFVVTCDSDTDPFCMHHFRIIDHINMRGDLIKLKSFEGVSAIGSPFCSVINDGEAPGMFTIVPVGLSSGNHGFYDPVSIALTTTDDTDNANGSPVDEIDNINILSGPSQTTSCVGGLIYTAGNALVFQDKIIDPADASKERSVLGLYINGMRGIGADRDYVVVRTLDDAYIVFKHPLHEINQGPTPVIFCGRTYGADSAVIATHAVVSSLMQDVQRLHSITNVVHPNDESGMTVGYRTASQIEEQVYLMGMEEITKRFVELFGGKPKEEEAVDRLGRAVSYIKELSDQKKLTIKSDDEASTSATKPISDKLKLFGVTTFPGFYVQADPEGVHAFNLIHLSMSNVVIMYDVDEV